MRAWVLPTVAIATAPAAAAAQVAPPAMTPRSLEAMPPRSSPPHGTASFSPMHLAADMIEVTVETSMPGLPRLAVAVMLGVRAADGPDERANFGMSFGASIGYYVLGSFSTGVAVGLEGQISSLDQREVPGDVTPVIVGDGAEASLWVGGKWTVAPGASITAQLGAAWRRDLDTYEGDMVGPDRVRPMANLLLGWTL
ncbi:MAG: hypothetical protein JNK64_15545 [Myxococcales bacterium]|nr:hypothetical protein [Myxococcales bacterium]